MQCHTTYLVAVAATLSVSVACVPRPSISAPSSVGELEIRGTTLMMVGGRGWFTAWRDADGEAREVFRGATRNDAISTWVTVDSAFESMPHCH